MPATPAAPRPPSRPRRARHATGQGKKKAREAPAKKWDVYNHTSSGSLTHLAGNLSNKPAARSDHTAQPETEPAFNRFALKPLALGHHATRPKCSGHLAGSGRPGRGRR